MLAAALQLPADRHQRVVRRRHFQHRRQLAAHAERRAEAVRRAVQRHRLGDRGSEFCGNPERHEYELYLAVEDIDHSRTKTKSPQTNGICERFHKTALNEFYRVAFRKKVYRSIDELQADLDAWIREYDDTRPHQGRWCFGKTPMRTFLDAMPMTKEKMIAA